MPKRAFWPAALVVIGLIFLASNLFLLPREFTNLWPLIAIVAGLGGLVVSDKEGWDVIAKKSSKKSKRK